MKAYMQKPQGQVSSILKRSDHDPIDHNIPKQHRQYCETETVAFGSVPFKRLNDFENEDPDVPEENPQLQHQSAQAWFADKCNPSPTSMASMLVKGCVGAMDLYPTWIGFLCF